MLPCSDWKQCRNSLISVPFVLFHLLSIFPFTFDLTFLTSRLCSAAALTLIYKEDRKCWAFCDKKKVDECGDKTVCKSEEHYHLWNICLPSNVASKAACYVDCISLRDASALTRRRITSVNKIAPVLERAHASALCLLTKRRRRWLSE